MEVIASKERARQEAGVKAHGKKLTAMAGAAQEGAVRWN